MNDPDDIWPPPALPDETVKPPRKILTRLPVYSLVGAVYGAVSGLLIFAIELWMPGGIVDFFQHYIGDILGTALIFATIGFFIGTAIGFVCGLTSKFAAIWPVVGGFGAWILVMDWGQLSYEGVMIGPSGYELQWIFVALGLILGTIAVLDHRRNRPVFPLMRWLKGL